MSRLFVRELTLHSGVEAYTYSFRPGVNVIVGPVGSGKTSLLELVKYTLGGSATLSWAVQNAVTSSSVALQLDAASIVLNRQIGSQTVDVFREDAGTPAQTLAVAPGRRALRTVSDYLLDLLGIPALRVPRSRRKPMAAVSRLTFYDIYAYLYLQQAEIDRSVVSHLDSYREPKRRATFELLYGLSDAALVDLEVQRGELNERIGDEERRADHIRRFLIAAAQPSADILRRDRERLSAAQEAAAAQLRGLQEDVRIATPSSSGTRARLALAEESLANAHAQLDKLRADLSRLRAVAAQLELDWQRLQKSGAAAETLSGLDFKVCPRCLQEVAPARGDPGACYVCLQQQDPMDVRLRLQDEQGRVEAQWNETLELIAADEQGISAATSNSALISEEVAALRATLDAETENFVSPRFRQIEEASAQLALREAQLREIERVGRLWEQYEEVVGEVASGKRRLAALTKQIDELRASLEQGRQRVALLSDQFAEILADFQLPWLESARIDMKSYLPIINGRSFDDLSSGGMKALVNDAYHLAALRYALVYADSLMPLLQVIDSPRKTLGSGPEDRALSTNVYRRLRIMQDAFGQGFQLIVADNDVPDLAREWVVAHLDYEHPGVPFVEHPGPEKVEVDR